MNRRVAYIDFAKGLSMCIVMLFHIKGILNVQYGTIVENLLFSACMLPPFFCISGLFFKEHDSARVFFLKKVFRLLIPFMGFYLLTAVALPNFLHYYFGMDFGTVLGWPSLWAFIWPGEYPNIPLWFLWSLFLMNILFWIICRISTKWFPNHRIPAMITMVAAFTLLGNIAGYALTQDIATLCKTLQNLPFFFVGYCIAKRRDVFILNTTFINKRLLYLIVTLPAVLFAAYLPSLLSHESVVADIMLFYIQGIIGIGFVLAFSAFFDHVRLISYLGRHNIVILLSHGLLVRLCAPIVVSLSQAIGAHAAIIALWLLLIAAYFLFIVVLRKILRLFTLFNPLIYRIFA